MFEINGKVAIITGAAGGIGLAISKQFSELGAKLVLVDKAESLKNEANKKIKKTEFQPLILNADLTKEEDIGRIVKETKEKFGRIDILVNCAGVNVRKEIDKYTSGEWDWILNVNLKAIFNLTNKVAEVMKENSYGKIINLSSIQAVTCWNGKGRFSLAPYGASKAALVSLTKSFALDLARHNITVNAILPAFVDTPLVENLKKDVALYKDILSRTPIGRFAKPSEIANVAVFLASDASSYVTGHALLVDGGWTIE